MECGRRGTALVHRCTETSPGHDRRLLRHAGQAALSTGKWLRSLLSVFTGSGHRGRTKMPGGAHPQATFEVLDFPDDTWNRGCTPPQRWSPPCPPARFPTHSSFPTPMQAALTPGGLLSEPASFHLFRCQPTSSRKPFWYREQWLRSVPAWQMPA